MKKTSLFLFSLMLFSTLSLFVSADALVTTYWTGTDNEDHVVIDGETNPKISFWLSSLNNADYEYEISLFQDGDLIEDLYFGEFSLNQYESFTGFFEVDVSQLSNGEYAVSVVVSDDGNWGDLKTLTFEIDGELENSLPTIPSNPNPEDGEGSVSLSLQSLNWDDSFDADGDDLRYDVYFGTTSNNLEIVAGNLLSSQVPNFNQIYGNLNQNRDYYWRVVVYDGFGNVEGPTWKFTTEQVAGGNNVPTAPSNPNPFNGASNVNVNIGSLSWDESTDEDGDELTYDVYFGTSELLSEEDQIADNILETNVDIPTLDYNTKYYWLVVVTDGEDLNYEQYWSFTTKDEDSNGENTAPTKPSNPFPSNGATKVSISLTRLDWSDSFDADGDDLRYDVYFGTTSNLGSSHIIANDLVFSQHQLSKLSYDTKYYWKVVVTDGFTSVSSDTWTFETKDKSSNGDDDDDQSHPSGNIDDIGNFPDVLNYDDSFGEEEQELVNVPSKSKDMDDFLIFLGALLVIIVGLLIVLFIWQLNR